MTLHSHQCRTCGHIWNHNRDRLKPSRIVSAHTCESCGDTCYTSNYPIRGAPIWEGREVYNPWVAFAYLVFVGLILILAAWVLTTGI